MTVIITNLKQPLETPHWLKSIGAKPVKQKQQNLIVFESGVIIMMILKCDAAILVGFIFVKN